MQLRELCTEDQQPSQTCWWDKQKVWWWLEALDNSRALLLFNVNCTRCIGTHLFIPWHSLYLSIYFCTGNLSWRERPTLQNQVLTFSPAYRQTAVCELFVHVADELFEQCSSMTVRLFPLRQSSKVRYIPLFYLLCLWCAIPLKRI